MDDLMSMDSTDLAKRFMELEMERRRLDDAMKEVNRQKEEVKRVLLEGFACKGWRSTRVDDMTVFLVKRVSAKVTGDRVKLTQAVADYAPERVAGREGDHRSDLWSQQS